MDKLFREINTWMTYVGRYYKTPKHFIREAEKHGITRRIPAQVARGMQYGDRVVLLRYGRKDYVFAFAEMVIESVILEGEIADEIGHELQKEGKASYTPSGGMVTRECGSYMIFGSWSVDAELSEIVGKAIEIAKRKEKDIFVMIGGKLSRVYNQPIILSPAPKFTRGFIRANDQATFEMSVNEQERDKNIICIESYQKADRKSGASSARRSPIRTPMLTAPLS
jgi:hypothetical protein